MPDKWKKNKLFFFSFRVPMAIIGSLLIWTGAYDIFDLEFKRDSDTQIYLDGGMILGAIVGLLATNTVNWCSNMHPSDTLFDTDARTSVVCSCC